jgi:DNA mismatch repair protein MSH3
VDDLEKYNPPPFMCLIEEKAAKNSDVSIGMITICPSTGKVVWDLFEGKKCYSLKELG